jgi:hypothetical protein
MEYLDAQGTGTPVWTQLRRVTSIPEGINAYVEVS